MRTPKTAAKRTAKVAAKPANGPAATTARKAAPRLAEPAGPPPAAAGRGERPHVAPRRKIPAAGYAAPTSRADDPPGSAGAELISTTIQAAAELAQIGLTVGRQTLQSMIDRLPKP